MVRLKIRYLLCEIIHDDGAHKELPVTQKSLTNCIKALTQQLYGDYGLAMLQRHFYVEYLNVATSMFVVKCKREKCEMVRTVLTMMTNIYSNPLTIHVIHVSGTIRGCYKFVLRYHRRNLPTLLKDCHTDEEKSQLKKIIEGTNTAAKDHQPLTPASYMDTFMDQLQSHVT